MRAWTWMAPLAVGVSFWLFLLGPRVGVYGRPSSGALTYSSLLEGVLMGAARIVTHPVVPVVHLIRSNSDGEKANCADGCPPAWLVCTASGRAKATASNPIESVFLLCTMSSLCDATARPWREARPSDEAAWIRESPSPELGDLFCRLRGPRGSPLTQPGDCGPGGRGLGVKLRRVKSIGTGYSRVRDQFLQTSDGDSSRARSYGMKIKK